MNKTVTSALGSGTDGLFLLDFVSLARFCRETLLSENCSYRRLNDDEDEGKCKSAV